MKESIQPFERAGARLKLHEIMSNNFIGGVFWALGATIGLAIIFAILTIISNNINLIPVIGSFVSEIIDFVINKNPDLR